MASGIRRPRYNCCKRRLYVVRKLNAGNQFLSFDCVLIISWYNMGKGINSVRFTAYEIYMVIRLARYHSVLEFAPWLLALRSSWYVQATQKRGVEML